MTKQEYAAYEKSVADFITDEEISFLSTGTAEVCGGQDADPWFSWHPCDMCNSALGGNREYLYARDLHGDIVQFEICEDCVYYVNYGRLDDLTMAAIQ
jgi:hypothetical protein